MKSKRMIALVLCIALAVMPMQAFAATGESIELTRQECLDKMDFGVSFLTMSRDKYSAAVWNEISTEFDRVKTVIMQSEDETEIRELSDDFLNVLLELGSMTVKKVPEGMSVASVKKMYIQKLQELYQTLNKKEYSDYYWDGIDEAYHIGIKDIREARSLAEIARAYITAAEVLTFQTSTDEMEEGREEYISDLKGYMTDEFRKADYTEDVWKKIKDAYDKALKNLAAAQDEEELEIIWTDALDVMEQYTDVSFLEYWSIRDSYLDEKVSDLMEIWDSLNRSLYSEKGIAKIEGIVWQAADEIFGANSMKAADKIYQKAYSGIRKVKTAKQEVPAERKRAKKILKKYLNNPKYNQKKVKAVVRNGVKAISKCSTLDSIAKTLQKYRRKAEKTAYMFRIQSSAGEGGTITKSKKVVYGDSVRFKMKPDKGYKVAGVWVDGSYVGVRHSYTFTKVKKAHKIRVEFKKK